MSYNTSILTITTLSPDDPLYWRQRTPVDCATIQVIGIFLCLAAFVGIVLNGSLLSSFIRYKGLRTPQNVFIMFISVFGLLASIISLPFAGSSSIFCYWLYNRVGCHIEAVVQFLYGCSSCYLLCTASLSRCYIIVRPFKAKSITVTKSVITSTIAVLIALLWTILPLIGWNEYTLEDARISCCTNLHDRRLLFVSYNLFIFIVVYCIPLIILAISNTIIFIGLKRMREKLAHGGKAELSQKKIEMERRILNSIIMTMFGFVFTWTPYTVAFFISAFSEYKTPPIITFLCACFAKTSVIWVPFVYLTTSTQFRVHFVNPNILDKVGGATTVAPRGESVNAITVARQPLPQINITDAKEE